MPIHAYFFSQAHCAPQLSYCRYAAAHLACLCATTNLSISFLLKLLLAFEDFRYHPVLFATHGHYGLTAKLLTCGALDFLVFWCLVVWLGSLASLMWFTC